MVSDFSAFQAKWLLNNPTFTNEYYSEGNSVATHKNVFCNVPSFCGLSQWFMEEEDKSSVSQNAQIVHVIKVFFKCKAGLGTTPSS